LLRGRLSCRVSRTGHSTAVVGPLLAVTAQLAWSQAITPPAAQQPTDIGRVTTGPGEAETVTPSATTTRAAALEEKKQAPNIVDVQPLSEIVKLPDINTAEALQRIPGISLETDSGEGRFINVLYGCIIVRSM
jgi:outer membrane receptor for ferrienterochelin and colicin